jgi:hypothetical protein
MRLRSCSCPRASATSGIRNDRDGANKAQIEGRECATLCHLFDLYSRWFADKLRGARRARSRVWKQSWTPIDWMLTGKI